MGIVKCYLFMKLRELKALRFNQLKPKTNMKNKVTLTIELTFSDEAEVTNKDTQEIIENTLTALRHQVNSGMGIAPEEADYITETINVSTENETGILWDMKNDCSI